jgi:hypothetical protein
MNKSINQNKVESLSFYDMGHPKLNFLTCHFLHWAKGSCSALVVCEDHQKARLEMTSFDSVDYLCFTKYKTITYISLVPSTRELAHFNLVTSVSPQEPYWQQYINTKTPFT